MREVEERAARAYRKCFGAEPDLIASAPGRVNLIGEHTDYNGGFALPCAIDRRVAAAVGRGGDTLYSADFDDERRLRGESGGWADYPRGVARALGEEVSGLGDFRAAFAGEVPRGSSLSSSAAIESATALALDALFGLGLDRKTLALACQRAENEFVGAPTGIMDQSASLMGRTGAALFLDCRTLAAETVPLPLAEHGLAVLVIDTRVAHSHADGGYGARRASCEAGAATLGAASLREVPAELDAARSAAGCGQRMHEARWRRLCPRAYGRFAQLYAASYARIGSAPLLLAADLMAESGRLGLTPDRPGTSAARVGGGATR